MSICLFVLFDVLLVFVCIYLFLFVYNFFLKILLLCC
jgi:hypothetical protein